MAAKKKANTKDEPEIYFAYDKNAKDGPREHDLEGVIYPLLAKGPGTEMPWKHAKYLLKDDSFVVLNAKGERMQLELPKPKYSRNLNLPASMVVASLGELKIDALRARAPDLPKNAKASDIIEHLMSRDEGDAKVTTSVDPIAPPVNVDLENAEIVEDGHPDGDAAMADSLLGPVPNPVSPA